MSRCSVSLSFARLAHLVKREREREEMPVLESAIYDLPDLSLYNYNITLRDLSPLSDASRARVSNESPTRKQRVSRVERI